MWGVITKIFAKNSSNNDAQSGEHQAEAADPKRHEVDMEDTFVTKQAKQRASVKWLLSKAFNNRVPENLKEPFYRDHEDQEHLKPQILGGLANAEIYCMALGNIYSDPNYHSLNHWAILKTLTQKGVYIAEPSDAQLTETTLIQTNPLRMSAHMAVIESIMLLYSREVVTSDRVLAAVQRFSYGRYPTPPPPQNHEEGLFMWMTHASDALNKRIEQDSEISNGIENNRAIKSVGFHKIEDMKDLGDGVALAALISFYCADELPWSAIKISHVPTVQDSLYNLGLIRDFCNRCLSVSIFHVTPEDITYMQDSMRQNIVVFLADLFNVIEIHPAKCVRYPGMDKYNVTKSAPPHAQLRKTNSLQHSVSEMSEDSLRRGSDDFVVHRGKVIPTLRAMMQDEPLMAARLKGNKEKQNNDSKADERGEVAAGRPSNWEDTRKSSFAGRRSRRNSTSDDSQLTIENFGGSQDNINFIGRNPDKEVGAHVGRKISAPSPPSYFAENAPIRSTLQDARGSFQLGYDNDSEKRDDEKEKYKLKRQLSSDDVSFRNLISNKENIIKDALQEKESQKRIDLGELTQKLTGQLPNVQTVYMQHGDVPDSSSSNNKQPEKKTSFAALPNTTTWQQQSSNNQEYGNTNGSGDSGHGSNGANAAQLTDVRLKLEEKRRMIETEKRRMEMAMNKQRQKVGKAAFLQAVAKEINDDTSTVERKWLEDRQPFIESKRTPELENMDLEQYQQSLAHLNDIQSDIQRLASQQSQIQAAQQQSIIAQQQKQIQLLQQQQEYQNLQKQQYVPQQMYSPQIYQQTQQTMHPTGLQSSASAPHIPQSLYQQSRIQEQPQFFLHDHSPQPMTPPVVPQRRTWAQQSAAPPILQQTDPYQQSEMNNWNKMQNTGGFVLHHSSDRYGDGSFAVNNSRVQNGDEQLHHSNSFTLSQQHLQQQPPQQFGTSHSTPSASPQHRNVHRQISQLMDDSKKSSILVSLQQMDSPLRKSSSITHAPIPAPPADDMEPQNISFIGNSDDQLSEGLSKLNITSGSRTYRIPSPTRPSISRGAFHQQSPPLSESPVPMAEVSSLEADPSKKKGFYIQFDDDPPKRPKPPLRTKRMSPKKERSYVEDETDTSARRDKRKQFETELQQDRFRKEDEESRRQFLIQQERDRLRAKREASQERQKVTATSALIIEDKEPDPDLAERMKKRILLASLQRKQELEEAKAMKEAEAQARRDREKEKEDEKARKKGEQAARRAAILEQYKLKKAMEEAEREGKVFDRSELMGSLKPTPKMRPKAAARQRPKTIHIDSGSVEMAEGMLQPSRGKKGSSSNLTGNSTMRRDYYRGSQDSLADRSASSGMLYRDSPDDSRGMSPCHSANQTLGRRSSYKTSRDPSPAQVRGRPKYSNYQNFKGRKSSSLMNLYGSSTDQDSLLYRYGDTDSGLGRATPPRRAPSPGMGSLRHLPSPSGPGSLPGLMSKGRRMFDDGSSDISSTASSMMDYNGPRLYKQPATKSNRGIILNAVEYCVFPGVVNREPKKRVLEEINRSESKHFLILFRDAGCQFRALYSYCPDGEEVVKLYGTGPKQVNDRMFDKFFKYNSGGKCFSQIHTKHLTVTIDAFTIHNSLWQGKKVHLPNKKDMALVI